MALLDNDNKNNLIRTRLYSIFAHHEVNFMDQSITKPLEHNMCNRILPNQGLEN